MENEFTVSIKAARVGSGLTIRQMASKLGISKGTLVNWEKGRTQPPFEKIQQICQITNTPINHIVVQK